MNPGTAAVLCESGGAVVPLQRGGNRCGTREPQGGGTGRASNPVAGSKRRSDWTAWSVGSGGSLQEQLGQQDSRTNVEAGPQLSSRVYVA